MKEVRSYVLRSVLSTLGLSVYILADTLFIAKGGQSGINCLKYRLAIV